MGFKKIVKLTRLEVTFDYIGFPKKKKNFFMKAKLSLLYKQKILMKANTKLYNTQYSAL